MQTTAPTNATGTASPEAPTQGGVDLASTLAQLGIAPDVVANMVAASTEIPPLVNPATQPAPASLPTAVPVGLVVPPLDPSSDDLAQFKYANLSAKAEGLTKSYLLETKGLSDLRAASIDPTQQAVIDGQIAVLGDNYRQLHGQYTDAMASGSATPRTAKKSLGEKPNKEITATPSGAKLVAGTRGVGTLRFTDKQIADQQKAEMDAKVAAGTHEYSLTKNGLNTVQAKKSAGQSVGVVAGRWIAAMKAKGWSAEQIAEVFEESKKQK